MFCYKLKENDLLNQRSLSGVLMTKGWMNFEKRNEKLDAYINTLLDFEDTDVKKIEVKPVEKIEIDNPPEIFKPIDILEATRDFIKENMKKQEKPFIEKKGKRIVRDPDLDNLGTIKRLGE
jgi:hypothetical protein